MSVVRRWPYRTARKRRDGRLCLPLVAFACMQPVTGCSTLQSLSALERCGLPPAGWQQIADTPDDPLLNTETRAHAKEGFRVFWFESAAGERLMCIAQDQDRRAFDSDCHSWRIWFTQRDGQWRHVEGRDSFVYCRHR